MDKKWPFGFFVYRNWGDKEENVSAVPEAEVWENAAEPEEDSVVDSVMGIESPLENLKFTAEQDDFDESEDIATPAGNDWEACEEDARFYDDEDDENLPDLEEELEIALEAAHKEEAKKQRLIKGVTAGVALLGALGLAAGFGIRAYLKNK